MPDVKRPHKLDLYRLAVQHPLAEAAFLERVYGYYRRGAAPTRLREDFAGTAAVAAAWTAIGEDRRALALECHAPTLRWARKRAGHELGDRAGDLHFLRGDSARLCPPLVPRVDVTAALNFSVFIYHDRVDLIRYMVGARRGLVRGGVLVVDAYGGPGALRVGVQRRRVTPAAHEGVGPFGYRWEQRRHDAATARVDCRIHFTLAGGARLDDAFVYDWRLWSPAELAAAMLDAGFVRAEVWCDRYDAKRKRSDGVYRPVRQIRPRQDWVAYVVGVK